MLSQSADVAVATSIAVYINVVSCCNINVTIDVDISGTAKTVSTAIAEAKGLSSAVAKAYASAYSFASIFVMSISTSRSLSQVLANKCCKSSLCIDKDYPSYKWSCCNVVGIMTDIYSIIADSDLQYQAANMSILLKDSFTAVDSLNETTIIEVTSNIQKTVSYNLTCCCCGDELLTTPKPTYDTLPLETIVEPSTLSDQKTDPTKYPDVESPVVDLP